MTKKGDKIGHHTRRRVEYRRLDEMSQYERNPRKNDHAVDAVAASIRDFGWRVPIVLDRNGVIVCGHTRYKAAIKLGMKTVPCVVASHLDDMQSRAYRLADNKVAELSRWDNTLLASEMETVKGIFRMDEYGFKELEHLGQETIDGMFDDVHHYVDCPHCGAKLDVVSGEAREAQC